MQEIAERLQAAIVHAGELKHFLQNLCVTTYADLEKHLGERDVLEQNFPMCAETTECVGKPVWGDVKLGRIPEFLYVDARAEVLDVRPQARAADAATFREAFSRTFQYFQSRCQHHIHPLVTDNKTGQVKRIVPNACRAKNKPTECKHEAPWINRVSPKWMSQPLIVCKGIAKLFKLGTSGIRNWLGADS